MRLIDADALTGLFEQDDDTFLSQDVRHIVLHEKTIDAVPVVRCKDCKYFDFEYKRRVMPWGICRRDSLMRDARDFDDFCKHGERRQE